MKKPYQIKSQRAVKRLEEMGGCSCGPSGPLMPCMNCSKDRDSRLMTVFSLTCKNEASNAFSGGTGWHITKRESIITARSC